MPIQIKKYLIIKKGFKSDIFLVLKKMTALSCVAGLVMITNLPLFDAYEAHVVNITARIVNDIPCIDPPGGEFCSDGELKVELSVTLTGAEIYYTVDGTNPVCGLTTKYYIPFNISDGLVTVKAVACHEKLRNGELVVIQSAVMAKEFNSSLPSVTVTSPVDGAVWYCTRTYPIEWTVENYKGNVNDLTVDIIYIVDKDDDGVISAGDDNHLVAENLTTGDIGSYLFKVDRDKGYCYTGYAWAKVIVAEPDNCSGFGISGRIYEPMPPNDLSVNIIPDNFSNASADPIVGSVGDILDDNNPVDIVGDTGEDSESEEGEGQDGDDSANEELETDEDLETDDNTDTNDVADEVSEDVRNEDGEEIDDDTEDDLAVDNDDLDLEELNEDEENLTTGEEENILGEEGIIMDREEDFEEEEDSNEDGDIDDNDENTDDDTEDDINDEESNITEDDDTANDVEDNNDSDDSDDAPADESPIEGDDDSTEIEFNL